MELVQYQVQLLDRLGLIASLNLREEQREKLREIADTMRMKKWDLVGKMVQGNKEIQRIMGSMSELRRQIRDKAGDAVSQAEELLSEDQREQLEQLRRSMLSHGRMGHGAAGGKLPE